MKNGLVIPTAFVSEKRVGDARTLETEAKLSGARKLITKQMTLQNRRCRSPHRFADSTSLAEQA